MNTLSIITDVNGPRLTGSPGFKKAADFAKTTLESWGLQNVAFDYWGEDFGRGWQLKKFNISVLQPDYTPIVAYPKAWTPGIKGTVQAEAVYLDAKTGRIFPNTREAKGQKLSSSLLQLRSSGLHVGRTPFNDSTLWQWPCRSVGTKRKIPRTQCCAAVGFCQVGILPERECLRC